MMYLVTLFRHMLTIQPFSPSGEWRVASGKKLVGKRNNRNNVATCFFFSVYARKRPWTGSMAPLPRPPYSPGVASGKRVASGKCFFLVFSSPHSWIFFNKCQKQCKWKYRASPIGNATSGEWEIHKHSKIQISHRYYLKGHHELRKIKLSVFRSGEWRVASDFFWFSLSQLLNLFQ